jgi:uracil-DNA glycosylase family 4
MGDSFARIDEEVISCRACPRLVEWREEVAITKRLSFAEEIYWGRPIPSFGDPGASVLVLGLAPAAQGGNRTGRIFTGDRSGDWLFEAMFKTGYANQPTSTHLGDGLELRDAFIAAAVRCAPPANKPLPAERDRCLGYLVREMRLLPELKVIVALGGFAWDAALRAAARSSLEIGKPKPRFGHLAETAVGPYLLLGSFHPSQQNTFTGKLTHEMLESVFHRARALAEGIPSDDPEGGTS